MPKGTLLIKDNNIDAVLFSLEVKNSASYGDGASSVVTVDLADQLVDVSQCSSIKVSLDLNIATTLGYCPWIITHSSNVLQALFYYFKGGKNMETLNNVYAPYIGANGNWYVENEDTGVKAQGPDGEQGPVGSQGIRGPKGDTGPMPLLTADLSVKEPGMALDAAVGPLLAVKADVTQQIQAAVDLLQKELQANNAAAAKAETVTITAIENDCYEYISSYKSVYKNGFLTLICYITCTKPSGEYVIVGNLPEGYGIHGATYYQDMDGGSVMLYCANRVIGIRGGTAGRQYMTTFTVPCIKY